MVLTGRTGKQGEKGALMQRETRTAAYQQPGVDDAFPDTLPYLVEAAKIAGLARIIIVREAMAGSRPEIPRIPSAVGRIAASRSSGRSRTRR
jgi:hypothetical protein